MIVCVCTVLALNAPSLCLQSVNPYLMGQRLDNVVAKKSVPHYPEEEEEPTTTSSSKTTA